MSTEVLTSSSELLFILYQNIWLAQLLTRGAS